MLKKDGDVIVVEFCRYQNREQRLADGWSEGNNVYHPVSHYYGSTYYWREEKDEHIHAKEVRHPGLRKHRTRRRSSLHRLPDGQQAKQPEVRSASLPKSSHSRHASLRLSSGRTSGNSSNAGRQLEANQPKGRRGPRR